ncbi:hypothetical protein ABEX25_04385 [Paenibacillus thiaminolyticus]
MRRSKQHRMSANGSRHSPQVIGLKAKAMACDAAPFYRIDKAAAIG